MNYVQIKSKTNKLIKAISFNPIESSISLNLFNKKNEVSILTRINKNNWNNKTNIQLEIVDVICLSNNAWLISLYEIKNFQFGPFVYRLGHVVFILERGVRFP